LCLQVLEIQNLFRKLFRRAIQSVFSQISMRHHALALLR